MKTANRTIIILAAALLASCMQEPAAPDTLPEDTLEGNKEAFISAVSGRRYGANTLNDGVIIVKFDDILAREIEDCGADMGAFQPLTRSTDHPLRKVTPQKMERLFPHAGKFEARTREAGLHRWYRLSLDEDMSLARAEALLAGSEGVEIVEFSPVVKANFDRSVITAEPIATASPSAAEYIFDDPRLPEQWHYYNDGSEKGMAAGCDIDVLSVWEGYSPGSSDVVVAIVDGGVDVDHEDLRDNMWSDPATGQHGYNFISNSVKITPESHGTHVAGTVGAVNNNGTGVAGVAGGDKGRGIPGVRLMSCQIFEADSENGAPGSSAIKWAADHGAVIAQNSWGYDENVNEVYQHDKDAIDYFIKYAGFDEHGNQAGPMAGGVVIFAAGNENRNIGSPAMYENCIAVAAVGADYQRAYYSNYGSWVDICAPGGDSNKKYEVLSTLPGNTYGKMQGTSMACPHVSGVAALIVSNLGGPGYTAEALRGALTTAVNETVLQYNSYEIGAGMVSAKNCVTGDRAIEHIVSLEIASPVTMKAGKVREIPISVKNPTGHALKVTLTPEVEGVSIRKESAKKLVVNIDGPEVMKSNWKEARVLDFHLSVVCDKEEGEEHSIDFQVNISANEAPYLIKEMEGMVIDELGKSTRISLNKYFFDPDADELVYTVSESSLGKFKMEGNQVSFSASGYGQEEIKVTATDAFGEEFSSEFMLLVRDGESRPLDIYPNPVTDGDLYFRGSGKMELDVSVYNSAGKCVIREKLESSPFNPAKIDISKLSGGTYTVKVTSDNGLETTQQIAKI